MRILTWNVNVLRTCLDYHPFSQMKKRNIEGLLDEMHAGIICFQEHKTRRGQLERTMACPGPYDAFWSFPRSKTGYSGVCTYVDSRYCVPLKAEEGITGLLLDDKASTMKPPWTPAERIGSYPEMEEMVFLDEVDGMAFDPKRLDMEGRAVVCDFGLFVLFNLYCPNETNDTRRPYKMNFFRVLQERVKLLQANGREVIIVGDINIMRAPIDSGEGGLRTLAEQHYEHPARRLLDNWCAPKGPMIDVVRESWPDREDMFTCWNQKLDARSANYGSRIDLVLCTPGLRPWIKGGDIEPKVYGSDHCPVNIDLHETITLGDGTVLHLKDQLNPADRPLSTVPVYSNDTPRQAPEPPRFATKFFEEFSAKQTTLKSFFGGGNPKKLVEPSPSPVPDLPPSESSVSQEEAEQSKVVARPSAPTEDEMMSMPFSLARAAFDTIDQGPGEPSQPSHATQSRISNGQASSSKPRPIDMTQAEETPVTNGVALKKKTPVSKSKSNAANTTPKPLSAQTKLSSFFAQPPVKTKRKSSETPLSPLKKRSLSHYPHTSHTERSTTITASTNYPTSTNTATATASDVTTSEQDALIAQAIAETDAEQASKRAKTNAEAAPIWSNLFAKKLPPLCTVHQKPCKDYIVKIPGPNKGKRFWLCSLPVGAGYDMGRSKRAREDVNPEFRCDFFLWDSANSRKEVPSASASGLKT